MICLILLTLLSLFAFLMIAITRVKSKVYNGKSRHIQLSLRQLIDNDVMSLDFVKWEKSTYPIEAETSY